MLPRPYYGDQDKRKWQIDTLKIFNDHVYEVQENTEYRVDFLAAGQNMSLTILLSPDFPLEKPSIYINPLVLHPWLAENSNQVVNAPGLLNYTLHSDIGRVVQAIIREFQNAVPNLSITTEAEVDQTMFPELAELNIDELKEILENTDLQDRIIQNVPLLMEQDIQTEELLNSIENIAKENIEQQQNVDRLKTDIIDRISSIVQMKINFEELNRKHQKLSEVFEPRNLRECLKEAAVKADEEAEGIAEQFLQGQIPVETFVSQFSEKRVLGQARKAREERLAHQLAQLDRATT